MRNALVLLVCLVLMVTAQSMWKVGLARIGGVDVGSGTLMGQLLKVIKSWRIMLGIGIFCCTTILWFDLLSRMELSQLYPMMSFTYVMAFFTGWWWLGETPNFTRLLGIVIICVGIFLVARTGE
jgi:drug/metabolite transporter (DMT)-like permease